MKKTVQYILFIALTLVTTVRASATEHDNNSTHQVRQHIINMYKSIDFKDVDTLSYQVFAKAYKGYLNMMNEGMVNDKKPILTICDFSLSSNSNRLWIIDLNEKKVLLNSYVAHGAASGQEFAMYFSNRPESHQSSIGFYITAETYTGKHGYSLRLFGMDKGFNSNAYNRDIVVHGADYVCSRFIEDNDRLGRSWGCPAVSSELSEKVINLIKDHTCLYIHYPSAKYIAGSYWLNKDVEQIPDLNGDFKPTKMKIRYEYGPILTKVSKTVSHFKFPLY